MSAPLPLALRTRFKRYIEEGLSGRAAAARLKLSAATGESGASFDNRIAALADPRFCVIKSPVSLFGKQSDVVRLIEMIEHLGAVDVHHDTLVSARISSVQGNFAQQGWPPFKQI